MIKILPGWYTEAREEIECEISTQAHKLNISGSFIWDSKCIDECISGIMNVLVRLKEEVKSEFNEKQLEDFKKLKEVIKKEEEKPAKKYTKSRKQNKKGA